MVPAEQPQNRVDSRRYRRCHRRTETLAELIETDPFDADKIYILGRPLRVEASSHFDRLTHADTMPAYRSRPAGRYGMPVKDMDGSRCSPQLHRINHDQKIFTVDLLKEIDAAKAKKNQANSSWKGYFFETGVNGLARSVIGNEIVADAEDESSSHGDYWRGRLKAMLKVQVSPVETVFGLAGHPASSARIPAT